ncbi:hypothetical protein KP509_05G097700 [Ceratopteris richardii]|uniref:Uncharacterized protein n=1 Tax=Ceratopteris richardii TaxID=49495 RepID=A0A8T2UPD0_CERRI|nr:hypothetical protein KP509_05G097700 [Ceratopteris richardii]
MTLISLQMSGPHLFAIALLADAKNSSAFTAMPTMFATDDCNEAHNTLTSPDLLARASTIIISFLPSLHGLQALAKLHPSTKTKVLFHVSDADLISAMEIPYPLLSIVAEYIDALSLETQCYSVPTDLIEVYPSNIFHATSKAEPLTHTTGRLPFGSLPTNGNYLIHHSCRGMIFKAFNLALYIMLYMENLLLMCGSSTSRSLYLPHQTYDPFDTGISTLLEAY